MENGVSAYPELEGRFPQVAGIEFGFDPSKPKGHRVDPSLVRVQGKDLNPEKVRALVCFSAPNDLISKRCKIFLFVHIFVSLQFCLFFHKSDGFEFLKQVLNLLCQIFE